MTFSNSPAYPNPNFITFSPPTAYKAPNPPTPIIEAGISDILSSVVEEIVVAEGVGGNVTCPDLETLHPRYTIISFHSQIRGVGNGTIAAKSRKPVLSCGGKNKRICVSPIGRVGYARSKQVAISFLKPINIIQIGERGRFGEEGSLPYG